MRLTHQHMLMGQAHERMLMGQTHKHVLMDRAPKDALMGRKSSHLTWHMRGNPILVAPCHLV